MNLFKKKKKQEYTLREFTALKENHSDKRNLSEKVKDPKEDVQIFKRKKAENRNDLTEKIIFLEKQLAQIESRTTDKKQEEKSLPFEVIEERITSLSKKIQLLEEMILGAESQNETTSYSSKPTYIIEQVNVENIVIEKVDYANNFGQLGIKELSGSLNIGTTYGAPPNLKKFTEKLDKMKAKEQQAKENIQRKYTSAQNRRQQEDKEE